MHVKPSGVLGIVVALALAGCGGGGGGDDRVKKTLACTVQSDAVCASVTGMVSASDESEHRTDCDKKRGTVSDACDPTGWVARCDAVFSGWVVLNYYYEMTAERLESNHQLCLGAGGTWTLSTR